MIVMAKTNIVRKLHILVTCYMDISQAIINYMFRDLWGFVVVEMTSTISVSVIWTIVWSYPDECAYKLQELFKKYTSHKTRI